MLRELERSLKKSVYEASYYEFFKWAFTILFPNEDYEDAQHIKVLCDLYQKEIERIIRKERKTKDIIVNIPPRTSKTLITHTILLPWIWILDPTITMIVASFDEELILLNAQYSKDIINSAEYQWLFGDKYKIRRDFDSKGFFMNNYGGFKMSKTTGSNITGHKGQVIVTDDIQNPKTAESEVMRKTSTEYYSRSLYNRLTPVQYGVRINIQQRLHEHDLTGYLLDTNPDDYYHICLPAELSNLVKPVELREIYTNGLLDPIRLDSGILRSFKKTLGSRGYSGQYEQTPSPDEGGIIKSEWFDIVKADSIVRDPINEPIHFFLDTAFTEKTENDPTGILACFKQGNYVYILDAISVYKDFPNLIKFIQEYVAGFRYNNASKIYVEPKASGQSIVQQLRATSMLNVIETPSPKDDKITRAYSITPTLESRRVKIVDGAYVNKYLEQLKMFPNAEHDEMIDITVYAVWQLLFDNNPDFMFLG